MIDTHCHLHDREWYSEEEQEQALTEAAQRGVDRVICIGTDPQDSQAAKKFAKEHTGAVKVFWTWGVHPEYAGDVNRGEEWAKECQGAVAIGEVGLDYHYEGFDREKQIRLFEEMLQLATGAGLPVALHIREAFPDALAVIDNFPGLTGVVHSFTGSKKVLKQVLERGFYVGVNGLVTYTTLPLPPLERMLLETDAPFLTPVPNRGTMNKPGYVSDVAKYLASVLGEKEELIQEQTTKNAERLFRI